MLDYNRLYLVVGRQKLAGLGQPLELLLAGGVAVLEAAGGAGARATVGGLLGAEGPLVFPPEEGPLDPDIHRVPGEDLVPPPLPVGVEGGVQGGPLEGLKPAPEVEGLVPGVKTLPALPGQLQRLPQPPVPPGEDPLHQPQPPLPP